jgi:signal transduction histidine kinase
LDNAMKFTVEGNIFISTFLMDSQQHSIYNRNSKKTNNKTVIDTNDDINTVIDGDKNDIIITVKDMGIGVNEHIKNRLFEKFVTNSTHGTGLGLYLSKKIVEAHGGNIWYKEQPNETENNSNNGGKYSKTNNKKQKSGSIFRFSLPTFIDERTNNFIKKDKTIEHEKEV